MRRRIATLAALALFSTPLAADVRITSTTAVEGPFAGMVGGMMPRMVMHIKGTKARADVEVGGQTMSSITDLASKQVTILNAATKTAQVLTVGSTPVAGASAAVLPEIESSFKPTGKTQVIAGTTCDEVEVRLAISTAKAAASAPAEAGAMMKNLRVVLNGTMWVGKSGPGVAEYLAFTSSAARQGAAALMSSFPGAGGNGLDRLMEAFSGAGGMPYLTELALTIEGNEQLAAFLKQQAPIKVTTKVVDVSTDPIPDDLFRVPEGYQIKQQ